MLYDVSQRYIEELVSIVEYRHIFGMVFDEDGPLSMEREMAIFHKVENVLRVRYPLFRIKIIACALKILGVDHFKGQIDFLSQADHDVGNDKMIVGIDAVCEEDYNTPCDAFLNELYGAK